MFYPPNGRKEAKKSWEFGDCLTASNRDTPPGRRLLAQLSHFGRDPVEVGILRQEFVHFLEPDKDVTGEAIDFLMEMPDLELGLQVDVVLDIGVDPIFRGLPVLTEEDKDGEKDGLE